MKNFKLVYTREFVDGLTECIDYIKKDSLAAAKIFEINVRKKVKLLKEFPEIGKIHDDPRLKGIRVLTIGNYLVLYEVIQDEKLIFLHVFSNGARDYHSLVSWIFNDA